MPSFPKSLSSPSTFGVKITASTGAIIEIVPAKQKTKINRICFTFISAPPFFTVQWIIYRNWNCVDLCKYTKENKICQHDNNGQTRTGGKFRIEPHPALDG